VVIDDVISRVVSNRHASSAALSQSDAFYTTVSKFEDLFPALIQHQREKLSRLTQLQEKYEDYLNDCWDREQGWPG
jgi:uncharacterized protein YecA (UPF0149 family)